MNRQREHSLVTFRKDEYWQIVCVINVLT